MTNDDMLAQQMKKKIVTTMTTGTCIFREEFFKTTLIYTDVGAVLFPVGQPALRLVM
jgi:hypothetical protein